MMGDAELIFTVTDANGVYSIPGLPDWTKTSATSISLMLGLLIFDFNRILAFRPRWIDLPMALWCLLPLPSSMANGLGFYDGFSTSLNQVFTWALPYLFGRIYLGDAEGLRELAIGLFIGGLVYVPLCAYEIRMSPQLHSMVYGFHQHSFLMTHRFGGWRPSPGWGPSAWVALCRATRTACRMFKSGGCPGAVNGRAPASSGKWAVSVSASSRP